jgi:hypothetical protein
MTRKIMTSTLAVAAIAAAAPAVAVAASPVQVTSLSTTPLCVRPGGSVNANVTVRNTTTAPQTFYAQDWVTELGLEVSRGSVMGSYTLPPLYSTTQSQTTKISPTTPYGYYTVNVGVGPSASSPTSWSRLSTTLIVLPFC